MFRGLMATVTAARDARLANGLSSGPPAHATSVRGVAIVYSLSMRHVTYAPSRLETVGVYVYHARRPSTTHLDLRPTSAGRRKTEREAARRHRVTAPWRRGATTPPPHDPRRADPRSQSACRAHSRSPAVASMVGPKCCGCAEIRNRMANSADDPRSRRRRRRPLPPTRNLLRVEFSTQTIWCMSTASERKSTGLPWRIRRPWCAMSLPFSHIEHISGGLPGCRSTHITSPAVGNG
jgi:hypothetical protein